MTEQAEENKSVVKSTSSKKTETKTSAVKKEYKIEEKELSIIEKMIKEMNETEDKIDFDGKKYTTVAKRNEILRKHLGFNVKVLTEALKVESDQVVFVCKIFVKHEGNWEEVATGHSEENRNSSEINKVAALENAETSSIGRALANLGLTGGEFASINEVKSKTGIDSSPEIVAHVKSIIKASGLNEKSLFAVYNIKSLDKAKSDTVMKILHECLKAISQKNNKKVNETKEEEEEVTL
jgi:hypothetical protein